MASIAGPLIAAPFTGGASLLGLSAGTAAGLGGALGAAGGVLSGLGNAAPALGGLVAGRQAGREVQTRVQQEQDRLAQGLYGGQLSAANIGTNQQLAGANLDLNRRQFGLSAPQTRASNAVRGDILANARDFSYGAPSMIGNIPVPSSSGGLRPSIFSQNTRDLGALMSSQALEGQQSGDAFSPLNFSPLPTAPSLTPLPEAGGLDKVLNTAGTIGSLYPVFSDILKRYLPKRDVEPSDDAGYG